jgi:hypothetical protein
VKNLILAVALLMVTVGCNPVTSRNPVGLAPADLTESVEALEGSWMTPDGEVFLLQVEDAKSGVAILRFLEKQEDKTKLKEVKLWFRSANEAMFASAKEEGEDAGKFVWARIQAENDRICLFIPNPKKMAAEVTAGRLAGTVQDEDKVTLGALTEEQVRRLASDEAAGLYEWTKPVVFFKTKR